MSIRNKAHMIEVKIEKFSKRGNGIGFFDRQDGIKCPVEVSFTVPGDTVRVMLLRKKQGIYGSRLEEILVPSPDRIEPLCKHFGDCGGCRWQQLRYEQQLKLKKDRVLHAFGDLITEDVDVKEIIGCTPPWHYRNKMEFSFSSDKANTPFLGLIMDSSKGKVFHLTECHLPNPWFAEAVQAAREWFKEFGLQAYHSRRDTGSLRTLTVREGQKSGDRMINLTVSGNPEYAVKKHQLEGFVAFMRAAIEPDDPNQQLSIFLTIQQVKKGHRTQFFEMHLYGETQIREILHIQTDPGEKPRPLTFSISPAAFFQPNTRQAEILYSQALMLARIPKDAVVYDLYCGTGTLGICAANIARQVVGIELNPEAALDARQNVKENSVSNVSILTGSVHDKLEEIRKDGVFDPPDLVMLDPPRAGLEPEAIDHLKELAPKKIVYISCNPVTQAQNIKELKTVGYRITTLQPIDQFPQTVHIENIAILERA